MSPKFLDTPLTNRVSSGVIENCAKELMVQRQMLFEGDRTAECGNFAALVFAGPPQLKAAD